MNTKLTFDQIVDGEGTYMAGISADLGRFKHLADSIICADGENLSVQASRTHYCVPRTDQGPYTEVEVGFPSVSPPDTWAEYFDGDFPEPHGLPYRIATAVIRKLLSIIPGAPDLFPEADDPTGSVYGYVPVALVREFIEAHGGEVHTVTSLDVLNGLPHDRK